MVTVEIQLDHLCLYIIGTLEINTTIDCIFTKIQF